MTISAVIIGAIGYYIGVERSFKLRLMAQSALCQVMIEANTSGEAASCATAFAPVRPTAAPAMPAGGR